jgi:hypothetical protein
MDDHLKKKKREITIDSENRQKKIGNFIYDVILSHVTHTIRRVFMEEAFPEITFHLLNVTVT